MMKNDLMAKLGDLTHYYDRIMALPNFVIIFCDDLGYGDLGCYGNTRIKTPNLDRMAAEGIRLMQHYTPSPACTPSRASLLTGRYPIRAGLPRVLGPLSHEGFPDSETTIAEVLRARGYASAIVGKWHLGRWPSQLPTRHGFDRWFGLPYSNDMDQPDRGFPPTPLMRDEAIVEQPADQDTLTRRYAEEAVRFIEDAGDRPFFLYLAHTMPHVPLHASDAFRGRSDAGRYGDVVEEIDWSVGEILRTLTERGLDENTLVVFTSDHGPWLTKGDQGGSAGELRNGKATVYDGGVRIPLVARWPGNLPAGAVVNEATIHMDLAPTMAALAGTALPDDRIIDGEDIWPVLVGAGLRSAHTFHYEWKGQRAIRKDRWKLHLPRLEEPRAYEAELYDMETDPYESKNLAREHPDVVTALQEEAEAFDAETGMDALRTPWVNAWARQP
jgi:arylsulfatase A-like enzyme